MLDKIGPHLKTVAGFLLTVAVNVVYRVTEDESPLPALNDLKGWMLLIITTGLATAGVYGIPNPGYIRPSATQTVIVADAAKGQGLPVGPAPQGTNPAEVLQGRNVGIAEQPDTGRHHRKFRLRGG